MSGGSPLMRSSPRFPYTESNPIECLEMLGHESMNLKSSSVGSGEEILSLQPSLTTAMVGSGKEETEVVVDRGMRNDTETEMSRRRRRKEVVGREKDFCTFPPVLTTLKWNGRPRFNYIRRVDDERWRLVITMERSENREVSRAVMEDGRTAFILVPSSGDDDMGVVDCGVGGDEVVEHGVADKYWDGGSSGGRDHAIFMIDDDSEALN